MFYNFIKDVLSGETTIEWYYYNTAIGNAPLFNVSEPRQFIYDYFLRGSKSLAFFFDPDNARSFIEEYFRNGQKEHLLSLEFSEIQRLSDERALHTISTFFLGLLLENCMDGCDTLSIHVDEADFPFSYLWFLLCLYHDFGYTVEDDKTTFSVPVGRAPHPKNHGFSMGEYRQLGDMKRRLGINVSPYSYLVNNRGKSVSLENGLISELTRYQTKNSHKNIIHTNLGAIIKSSRYSSKLITRYFNYCINERGRFDHGIIGGLLFYDRMIKNYIISYENALFLNGYRLPLDQFVLNDRRFGVNQLPVFSYIADCIIAHNIWKDSPESHDLYKHYKLDDLFDSNFEKITFRQNPILFLLVVADTIDPCKVYKTLSIEQSWQGINFDYRPAINAITVQQVNSNCPIDAIYARAKGLEAWTSTLCSDLDTTTKSFIITLM